MHVISRTGFLSTGYALLETLTVVIVGLLMLARFKSALAETLLVALITLIYVYMVRLIRDIDDPFEYSDSGVAGAAEVDLEVLHGYRRRSAARTMAASDTGASRSESSSVPTTALPARRCGPICRTLLTMRFRRSGPSLLILGSIVATFALTGVSILLTLGLHEEANEGDFELMQRIFEARRKSLEDEAVEAAELVVSIPTIRRAFLEHDRSKLSAECSQMFAVQKQKYGLDRAEFHEASGVTFPRLQRPEKFGEDDSQQRPMLLEAHRNEAIRLGIEIGTLPRLAAEGTRNFVEDVTNDMVSPRNAV